MILKIMGHTFHYEMENLCRVFFPYEKIRVVYDENVKSDEKLNVVTILNKAGESADIIVEASLFEVMDSRRFTVSICETDFMAECERKMAVALFEILSGLTGYTPEWGILTGVRPSKLMTYLMNQLDNEIAGNYFNKKLLVNKEKTNLTISVAEAEKRIIKKSRQDCFSLYVSIPFCPSRCSYCSFVSHSIESISAKKLLPQYIENLCYELIQIGKMTSALGIKPQTIYFGGGTPTTLEKNDLVKICETIKMNFDLSFLQEYTVEAGRPDTISQQKLYSLLNNGVQRISINPQTFNDAVLHEVRRNHTAAAAIAAYELARKIGFKSINMDLIAGLPTDSLDSFRNTMDITASLSPENITVHTLALKRSSSLITQENTVLDDKSTSKMLRYTDLKLKENGYFPYYMYRQSRSLGNLENIGWSKPGFESIYNVFMMEECQTVLAAGAGAVTKLKENNGNHIERIFNFKYPYEYNMRFDEILSRKSRVITFFNEYNN